MSERKEKAAQPPVRPQFQKVVIERGRQKVETVPPVRVPEREEERDAQENLPF